MKFFFDIAGLCDPNAPCMADPLPGICESVCARFEPGKTPPCTRWHTPDQRTDKRSAPDKYQDRIFDL